MRRALLSQALLAGALALPALHAWGQAVPAGLWKTIDDDGKTEKSLVRIVDQGGKLSGTIEKIFDPAHQDQRCTACTDERKDQPLLGMTIIRNVVHDEAAVWKGGDITDPENGKVYKVRLKVADDGRKLEVRGYIGVPLLGRTQTWVRVE